MAVSASPLRHSKSSLGWPVRARIRFGSAKARWLRFRQGRRARLAVCVVTLVGRHEAVVTKVTLYGAILHGGHRLKRREIIALRLPSGWRVKARVQWRFGSRCGIAFMTPVADFARILCEGAAVKSRAKRRRTPTTTTAPFLLPIHDEVALASVPGLADPLTGLAKWAKGYADRLRLWIAAKRDRGD